MCGITGILGKNKRPIEKHVLEAMTHALSHRGPDGYGTEIIENIGLGHRRLSIIDLETGAQPMSNENGTIRITFNGEIYNYRELRRQMEREGRRFRTQSDTEVIIHAYEKWGEDCVKYFRGMFAFGITDTRQRQIFLARDHFGIKPLYYLDNGDWFAFASEIQALKLIPSVSFDIDLLALDRYLWLQYIPAPLSIFKQIKKLPPASRVRTSFDGNMMPVETYWEPEFLPDEKRNEAEWLEEWETVVKESVHAHLVSDVPFGAFLSGGIDSAATTAYMVQLMDQPVKTFSIGFEEPEFNELPYARQVADQWNTEHYEEIVKPDALEILPKLVQHYGEPFGDSSAIPTYYLANFAKQYVPMVLSGDGGDELFAGYRSYMGWMAAIHDDKEECSLERWLTFINYMPFSLRRSLWRGELKHLAYFPLSEFERDFEKTRNLSPAHTAQYMDIKTYLPFDILTKVDVAAMIHGLEVRTPLVDVKVAELALKIPAQFNIKKNSSGEWTGKLLSKKAMRKYYAADFLNRPKTGFRCPLKKWFKEQGQLENFLKDSLLNPDAKLREYFDGKKIAAVTNGNNTGGQWLLLFLEEWLKQNSPGQTDPGAFTGPDLRLPVPGYSSSRNLTPGDVYMLASLYKGQGKLAKAEMLFTGIIEKENDETIIGGAYFHLGDICLKQQRNREALEYFKKCLALNPVHRKAAENLAMIENNR